MKSKITAHSDNYILTYCINRVETDNMLVRGRHYEMTKINFEISENVTRKAFDEMPISFSLFILTSLSKISTLNGIQKSTYSMQISR